MNGLTDRVILNIMACLVDKPVIRRECGQTLARVRVSWTYISIIIISLQRT